MSELAYAWAPITKTEKQDDGTLMVYGPAASSELDRDQQRLNAEWLDEAMPEWAQTGNIREQHDSKRAVGVGVGLSKTDDGKHHIAAHIIDPLAVLKIEKKVLKGFSVGIKNPRVTLGKADAPGGEIVGGSICEISVVDRPCNPTTLFEIAKADTVDGVLEIVDSAHVTEKTDAEAFGVPQAMYDQLDPTVQAALSALAVGGATVTTTAVKTDAVPQQLVVNVDMGAARDVGTVQAAHPIKTKADLREALKVDDAFRTHILTRAQALGLEAMVPSNTPAETPQPAAHAADPALVTKAEAVLRDVRTLAPSLAKADDGEAAVEPAAGEDEAEDISGVDEAIACIARLIVAEAESLALGNLNETCDIDLLLSAVRALKWFKENEQYEQEMEAGKSDTPDEAATSTAAVEPAQAPAATPETAAGDEPAADTTTEGAPATSEASDSAAVTKAEVAELVKAAVAEVTEAAKGREGALAAELAKAQQAVEEFRALPTAGGPALTRTAAQQAQARGGDADVLRQQAKTLLDKAAAVSDRDLAAGYKERATALLAKADA